MNERPIGVFDSGFGGLTAVRRLRDLMPSENIIYFGDTSRVPYGNRSRDTILKYARQDTRFLRSFDLKAIVIACGTVSSNCLPQLQAENDIPIIGVVEPAVRRAAALTRWGYTAGYVTYSEALELLEPAAEELAELPGIGRVLAERIVDYRTEHGPFEAAEDLTEVSGIGERKLAELEGRITAE